MVRGSLVVIKAFNLGSSAIRAFSRSSADRRPASRSWKVSTEWARSISSVDRTCWCSRLRIMNRLEAVVPAMISTSDVSNSTRVRIPGVRFSIDTEPFLRNEPVSSAIDGLQMARVGAARLQLLAELQNLIIDRARRRIRVIPPHLVQQLLPAQHTLRVFDKILQQLEFMCRQSNWLTGASRAHFGKVDLANAKAAGSGCGCLRPRPAQGGLHARHQLARTEWL